METTVPRLRAELPRLPARMQRLPLDNRGYPVPYFVARINGVPDFRVADTKKWSLCVNNSHCWVCGEVVGVNKTYVIGPMCAVNRTTSEPACHLDCAQFSATACPFLTLPKAQRRDTKLPEGVTDPGGISIPRNPGVTCLWTTRSYRLIDAGNGYLFRIGEPSAVQWYAEKFHATRAQVLASIDSGMPLLRKMAEQDLANGYSDALERLEEAYRNMIPWLPTG